MIVAAGQAPSTGGRARLGPSGRPGRHRGPVRAPAPARRAGDRRTGRSRGRGDAAPVLTRTFRVLVSSCDHVWGRAEAVLGKRGVTRRITPSVRAICPAL